MPEARDRISPAYLVAGVRSWDPASHRWDYVGTVHPPGLTVRSVRGGYFPSFAAGRIGRLTKSPPQFGQTPPRSRSTQSRQNVHSNVQIIASVAWGGRSLSQHSHPGRSSSMGAT